MTTEPLNHLYGIVEKEMRILYRKGTKFSPKKTYPTIYLGHTSLFAHCAIETINSEINCVVNAFYKTPEKYANIWNWYRKWMAIKLNRQIPTELQQVLKTWYAEGTGINDCFDCYLSGWSLPSNVYSSILLKCRHLQTQPTVDSLQQLMDLLRKTQYSRVIFNDNLHRWMRVTLMQHYIQTIYDADSEKNRELLFALSNFHRTMASIENNFNNYERFNHD